MHIPKIVKKLIVSTITVGLLLIMAGAAYALYSDRSVPALPLGADTGTPTTASPIKHTAPSPNVPASAAVEAISSPIQPGDEASISIQTLEGATCTIDVGYGGAPNDARFKQQTANDFGVVSWSWQVASSAPIGNWPIKVTCVYHNRTAVVIANLEIDKR